jgi:hypothetical protein
MKRKKPPKGGSPQDFGQVSGAPPPGFEERWSGYRPQPGDPAPAAGALGALGLGSHVDRERQAWEASHVAWLNANGLAWTPDELRSWYDNPDRDRLPMPGVLEWQKRISQQHSWRADVIGVEPAYRVPVPVPALDASAAREVAEHSGGPAKATPSASPGWRKGSPRPR